MISRNVPASHSCKYLSIYEQNLSYQISFNSKIVSRSVQYIDKHNYFYKIGDLKKSMFQSHLNLTKWRDLLFNDESNKNYLTKRWPRIEKELTETSENKNDKIELHVICECDESLKKLIKKIFFCYFSLSTSNLWRKIKPRNQPNDTFAINLC